MHTLNLLHDRAASERDQLAGELRRGEDQLQRMQQQGAQLLAYRGEYMQRWSAQFGRGGAIEIVHCYQSFMQRLEEALAQQQRQIEAAERAVQAMRQALLQAELRVASIGKLIERRRAEMARTLERREQRQTDETAQRVGRNRLQRRSSALS